MIARLLLFTVALAISGTSPLACAQAVPMDFALQAKFYPGGGGETTDPKILSKLPKPWELRLKNDGRFVQDTSVPVVRHNEIGIKKVRRIGVLPQVELKRLRQAINKKDFFGLPRDIASTSFSHSAVLVLKITMNGRTREVSFEAPNNKHEVDALTRFWAVWQAVLKQVPSPNENKEMASWIRRARPDLAK